MDQKVYIKKELYVVAMPLLMHRCILERNRTIRDIQELSYKFDISESLSEKRKILYSISGKRDEILQRARTLEYLINNVEIV